MSFQSHSFFGEAVVLLEGDTVVKEMLFSEFEAVLDGVVSAPECAGQTYPAVYVTVAEKLAIRAVVLFNLTFDEEGHIGSDWNIPLRMLAEDSEPGPDLGHGPIKICTHYTCPHKQYKEQLWSPEGNTLQLLATLRASIERNKLGFYAGDERRGQERRQSSDSDFNLDNELLKQLTTGIEAKFKSKLDSQEREFLAKTERLEQERDELREMVKALEHNIKVLEEHNQRHVDSIVSKYKSKVNRQLEQAAQRLREQMDAVNLELHYSQENEQQLRETLEKLQAKADPISATQDYMEQLQQLGVALVVSHPNLDADYTVQPEDMDDFLANPKAFIKRLLGDKDILRAS